MTSIFIVIYIYTVHIYYILHIYIYISIPFENLFKIWTNILFCNSAWLMYFSDLILIYKFYSYQFCYSLYPLKISIPWWVVFIVFYSKHCQHYWVSSHKNLASIYWCIFLCWRCVRFLTLYLIVGVCNTLNWIENVCVCHQQCIELIIEYNWLNGNRWVDIRP